MSNVGSFLRLNGKLFIFQIEGFEAEKSRPRQEILEPGSCTLSKHLSHQFT